MIKIGHELPVFTVKPRENPIETHRYRDDYYGKR
jgi:hypothetical protein